MTRRSTQAPLALILALILAQPLSASAAEAEQAPPAQQPADKPQDGVGQENPNGKEDQGGKPSEANKHYLHVELDAPKEVRDILHQHLTLLKKNKQEVPADEAGRTGIQQRAKREAAALLQTEGYFTPDFAFETPAADRWKLHVAPGPRVTISGVQISFGGDIAGDGEALAARRATLQKRWTLPAGAPFRQADWDAAKQNLLDDVASVDYAAARIADSQALIDTEKHTAILAVVLDSGPPFKLGELQVQGIEKLPHDLVDRYSTLRPGEAFALDKLLNLQSVLQNTPYFQSVIVDVERNPALAAAVPVRVQVKEANSRHLSAGAGFTTNTGARFEANWQDVNLRGKAWQLSTGLRVEQKEQSFYGDIMLPPRKGSQYRDSFGALINRSDVSGLVTNTQAFGITRARARDRIATSLSLRWQHESTETANTKKDSRTLTLDYGWKWTKLDNVMDPRDGLIIDLKAGGGLKAVLSDQNFLRTSGRVVWYRPIGERDTLILRGELGRTWAPSREGIPQAFLFRTGGAQTVRGYDYNSLGVDVDGATMGGRYMAVGSAEYVHWLDAKWGIASFADVGNATDDLQNMDPRLGYGIGGRWRSPAGPVALDLAYGQHDRRFRIHFGIAVAF